MASLLTIRNRVSSLVSDHSMILASDLTRIIQAEHETILSDTNWTQRRQDATINTVPTYSEGTLSTVGTAVTGVGTTFTTAMIGRFLRFASGTYFLRITAVGGPTSLTLEAAPAADVTDVRYVIFKSLYVLPANFSHVLNVVSDTSLREIHRSELDYLDPYRSSTATYPDTYTLHGPNSAGLYELELWPVPSTATTIRIEYTRTNTLVLDTDVPLYRTDILVWKAGEAAAFFLHSKTGDTSWLGLADRYHARYIETLEGARLDDLARHTPSMHIRDTWLRTGRGDDFYLAHDPIRLR